MVGILGIIGIVVVFLIAIIALIYNGFVRLNLRVDNSWAQIDVQLKRRYDLIPNLVSTVKGYMRHEKSTLEELTKLRSSLLSGSLAQRAKASDKVSEVMKTIFAVAENYPALKASENFKQLQEQISETEDKIAYSRQFYNDTVMRLNTSVQTFPKNIFAKIFGFKERDFFKAEGTVRESPKSEF
jgi:LemA protein